MRREFFINILFLVFVNLLIKPFYIFGIDRTVQNEVGAETYGIYFALMSYAWIFQIINDLGIQNYNNRTLSQSPQLIHKFFPNIIGLKLILGLLYIGLIFLGTAFIELESLSYPLLLFIGINWILNALMLYMRSNVSALGMYRKDSFLSVVDKLIMIIILSYLLWGRNSDVAFDLIWFVWAQGLSFLATIVLAWSLLYSKLKPPYISFDIKKVQLILKKAFPYALIIFLMTAYTRIDAVMLAALLPNGNEEAGLYASAYRLLDAANMFGYLFAGLLLPMFAKMLKQKEDTSNLVGLGFGLIMTGALSLAAATWFFKVPIMETLYTSGDAYSGQILGWLMLSFIGVSGGYIYGTLLTANGDLKPLNILFTIGLVLNIILNAVWIPKHAAQGAAIATFLTQSVVFIGQFVLARRMLHLKEGAALFIKVLLFGVLIFVAAWQLSIESSLSWWWRFGGVLVVGLVLSLGLGLFIHVKEILKERF